MNVGLSFDAFGRTHLIPVTKWPPRVSPDAPGMACITATPGVKTGNQRPSIVNMPLQRCHVSSTCRDCYSGNPKVRHTHVESINPQQQARVWRERPLTGRRGDRVPCVLGGSGLEWSPRQCGRKGCAGLKCCRLSLSCFLNNFTDFIF